MVGSSRDAPLEAANAPHLGSGAPSHRRILADVLGALAPVGAAAVWFFPWQAVRQIVIAYLAAALAEYSCTRLLRRLSTIGDGSASTTARKSSPWNRSGPAAPG